jgi:hypothetical protein
MFFARMVGPRDLPMASLTAELDLFCEAQVLAEVPLDRGCVQMRSAEPDMAVRTH